MPRTDDQFVIRMPNGMRPAITARAQTNRRSMNSEIVLILERALREGEMTTAGNSPDKRPAVVNRHETTLPGGPTNTHAYGASADAIDQ